MGEKYDRDFFYAEILPIRDPSVLHHGRSQRLQLFLMIPKTRAHVSAEHAHCLSPEPIAINMNMSNMNGSSKAYQPEDECVLYITMPHWDSITVLEVKFDATTMRKTAKFIRFINNLSLVNLPISIGDYGNFLYVASLNVQPPNTAHSLVQRAEYKSTRGMDGEDFSTTFHIKTISPNVYEQTGHIFQKVMEQPPAPPTILETSANGDSGNDTTPSSPSSSAAYSKTTGCTGKGQPLYSCSSSGSSSTPSSS